MTDEQARLKIRLDGAIDSIRALTFAHDLPLDSMIALANADAHLRHLRALLHAAAATH